MLLIDPVQVSVGGSQSEFAQAFERLQKIRPVLCLGVREDYYMEDQHSLCAKNCLGGVFLNAIWRGVRSGGTGEVTMTEASLSVTDNLARLKRACVGWHSNEKLAFVGIGNFCRNQIPADDEIFTDADVVPYKSLNEVCKFLEKTDRRAGAS